MPEAPYEEQAIEAADSTESSQDTRKRRGIVGFLLLLALVLFIIWWLWSRMAIVPDVVGMPEKDARAVIERAGFVVGDVDTDLTALEDPGNIDAQGLQPGTRAFKGEEIDLLVSGRIDAGRPDPDVVEVDDGSGGFGSDDEGTDSIRDKGDDEYNYPQGSISYEVVPQVLNQSAASAVSELQAAGFKVTKVYAPNSGGVADGNVFYQTPEPGALRDGDLIEIWISTGGPPGAYDTWEHPNR